MAITFDQIRPLFGKAFDDPAVTEFLATCGKVSKGKPDGADHYVQARPAGFDFLFVRPNDAKRGSPRLLQTVFLYVEGNDKHNQFANPPYGLAFTNRADLLKKLGKPARSWKIGKGEVPASAKTVDHDEWERDDLTISAHYGDDLVVRNFQLSPVGDD